jgi:hypothetical protein
MNTPSREYQLSGAAAQRVNHFQIFNNKDLVQTSGGNSITIGKGIKSPWGELLGAGRTFPNAFNIEYQTAPENGGVIGNHQGWRLDNMNQWMGSLKQAKQTSDFINSDEGKSVVKALSNL